MASPAEALAALHRRPLWRLLAVLSPLRALTAFQAGLAANMAGAATTSGRDETPARFA